MLPFPMNVEIIKKLIHGTPEERCTWQKRHVCYTVLRSTWCPVRRGTVCVPCFEGILVNIGVGTGGGQGERSPPHFPGRGGGGRRSPPPPFWARTYFKIPPRSLFFRPHNFTVLTPNQSVRRCFEKFIDVGTGGGKAGNPAPLPQCFSSVRVCVCVWGGGPSCWKPLRASFSVSSDKIFCIIGVYTISLRTNPRAFQMQEATLAANFTHYTNLFGSLSHQAGDSWSLWLMQLQMMLHWSCGVMIMGNDGGCEK